MKKILATSEIVGTCDHMGMECEVCATGDAVYDEENETLLMKLDRFVRPVGQIADKDHIFPGWLPAPQMVKEPVALEDALPLARDVFSRWTRKIRPCTKSTVNH